jgi:hypothetical protein
MVYNDIGDNQQKTHWLKESLTYYTDINETEKAKTIEEMLEPELT